MRGLIAMVVGSLTGGVGWWVGAKVGFMTAFFLSTILTAAGIYYAKRWMDEHLP